MSTPDRLALLEARLAKARAFEPTADTWLRLEGAAWVVIGPSGNVLRRAGTLEEAWSAAEAASASAARADRGATTPTPSTFTRSPIARPPAPSRPSGVDELAAAKRRTIAALEGRS